MRKYKIELIDKSGTRKHNLTVKPNLKRPLKEALMYEAYKRLTKGLAKYRSEFHIWQTEWILLQYYKI